jgi:hypothetical protein
MTLIALEYPPIPPELENQPPREVRLKPDAIAKNLAALGLMSLIGLYSAGALLFVFCEIAFQPDAPVLKGYIVDLGTHPAPKGGTWYDVTYEYTDSGVLYSNTQSVSSGFYERLFDGSFVAINAMVIGSHRFDEIHISAAEYMYERGFLWIALPLLSAIIVLTWRYSQVLLRCLVRDGQTTIGVIESKKSYKTRHGKAYLVKYRFRDSQNQWVEGNQMTVSEADYDVLLVGDRVVVLYDPIKPSRSLIYQYGPYEAV